MILRIFFLYFLILKCVPGSLWAQEKHFSVRIVQDDIVTKPQKEQSTITLEKKSFKIQVFLQNLKGIYTFASTSDSIYKIADEDNIPGFDTLPKMILEEGEYNRDKELLVSTKGWCYWFYDPGLSWHRFNRKIIILDSGKIVGAKTIKQLYFLPDRHTLKLKDNNDPIYLLFVGVGEEDETGKPLKELYRRKIKIEWRDED